MSSLKRLKHFKPLEALSKGVKECPEQAAAYGRCITANYQDIKPQQCQAEFEAFKACVTKVMGRKW